MKFCMNIYFDSRMNPIEFQVYRSKLKVIFFFVDKVHQIVSWYKS